MQLTVSDKKCFSHKCRGDTQPSCRCLGARLGFGAVKMSSLELYSKVRLDFRAVLEEVMDPLTSPLMSYLKNADFNMKLITPLNW